MDRQTGHVDADLIKKYSPDFVERGLYICGPLPFVKAIKDALTAIGVSANKVSADVWGYGWHFICHNRKEPDGQLESQEAQNNMNAVNKASASVATELIDEHGPVTGVVYRKPGLQGRRGGMALDMAHGSYAHFNPRHPQITYFSPTEREFFCLTRRRFISIPNRARGNQTA